MNHFLVLRRLLLRCRRSERTRRLTVTLITDARLSADKAGGKEADKRGIRRRAIGTDAGMA